MDQSKRTWSVPVTVEDIPDDGSHHELAADAAARDAVARLAGLRSIDNLEAVFDLTRRGDDGVEVRGEVRAKVGQTCVVTLEPVDNQVVEAVALIFAPPTEHGQAGEETRKRKKGAEPPEPLANGVIDLGAVATEFLILGLDPYPRKAGVDFAPLKEGDETVSPFAALEALKKRS